MGRVLADSIRTIPHIAAFDDMAANRYDNLDLSSLIPYLIDTAPVLALPYIAQAFDILGYKGWIFADTEQKQRDLLKIALQLNKYAGTPWAITNALNSIGITGVEIEEGLSIKYDGEAFYDGSITYGSGSWADFAVIIDASNFTAIDATAIANMTGVVLAWKNARSNLVGIWFSVNFIDTLQNNDSVSMDIQVITPPSHSIVTF